MSPTATGPLQQEPLILLVAHPRGRGAASADAVRRTAAMLCAGGFGTELVETSRDAGGPSAGVPWGASLHRRLARAEEEARPPAAVVAVGGDGMAHTVLNVLMERRALGGAPIPFGLVPAGTGNDLARHMRLPEDDPEMAAGRVLRRLDEGPRAMDLGRIELADGTRRWFGTAACCGIDAAVNELANSWSWPRGGAKYLAALPFEVLRFRQPFMGLAIDEPGGRTHLSGRRTLMLTVASTSSIGGGLRIVPGADPFDGRLEVFRVRALSRGRILRLFPRLMRGTHTDLREVEIIPALTAEIDAETRVYADGERVGSGPAVISVAAAALPVLL